MESYSAVEAGKKYHEQLCRLFRMLKQLYATLESKVLFRYAVKDLNDTKGPDYYVPSPLVFGSFPTFPLVNKIIPGQEARLEALRKPMNEIANMGVEQRIMKTIHSNLPS